MEDRSRNRFLSEEEISLWAHVTRHDEPLRRVRRIAVNRRSYAAPAKAHPDKATAAAPADLNAPSPPKPLLPAKTKPASPPLHAPFDPRVSRKIARGRHEIGARLDLHGMRQHDAYGALRRFLIRCQADGLRHVLIITGKGGKEDGSAALEFWKQEERGVLRRLVPHWLAEPSFRQLVVSFTESALHHGGSGALYVAIRKAPRSRHAK